MKTEPLIGKAATKKEVLSRLASIASVLIAAHGNVETGDIVLSTNAYLSRKPKEQVYLLTIEYVLKSKLQAKLVVLSCCQRKVSVLISDDLIFLQQLMLQLF